MIENMEQMEMKLGPSRTADEAQAALMGALGTRDLDTLSKELCRTTRDFREYNSEELSGLYMALTLLGTAVETGVMHKDWGTYDLVDHIRQIRMFCLSWALKQEKVEVIRE